MLAPQDQKEPMEQPEMEEHQVPMVNPAIKDPVDHPAHLAQQETQAKKEQQAMLVNSQDPKLAHQVSLVLQVNPALQVPLVNKAKLAKMADLAFPVLPAMLVLQVALAKLALQAAPVMQANPVFPAVANTAHLLVWLLVIKYGSLERMAKIINHLFSHISDQYRNRQKIMTFDYSFLFTSHTFHVILT